MAHLCKLYRLSPDDLLTQWEAFLFTAGAGQPQGQKILLNNATLEQFKEYLRQKYASDAKAGDAQKKRPTGAPLTVLNQSNFQSLYAEAYMFSMVGY